MLSESQLAIIKRIQTLQASLESGMNERLPVIFKGLTQQVIELTNDIPIDPKQRAKSIRAIIGLKTKISNTIVNNPEYVAEVATVLKGFTELKKLSDLYFSELLDGFSAKNELYQELLNANVEVTKDLLLGSGIRSNFGNAITEVLKANAAGNSNRTLLQKTLTEFIQGQPNELPFLQRYIKQTTSDAVMTFSREYDNTIAADLNLQFYFYAGTLISDSRQFCKSRAGRYFKKSEVENWANLGNWDGKKSGTTKTTIFSYCGGWGCRHQLHPVSKLQYTVAGKNGLTGMK